MSEDLYDGLSASHILDEMNKSLVVKKYKDTLLDPSISEITFLKMKSYI